jgi:hypothetical protein
VGAFRTEPKPNRALVRLFSRGMTFRDHLKAFAQSSTLNSIGSCCACFLGRIREGPEGAHRIAVVLIMIIITSCHIVR